MPVWNELYREAYTIDALTEPSPPPVDRRAGSWSALQAISRLAHAGCKAGDLDVTAFNGRLFSPRHAPLVEQRRIPDAVVRDVLLSLATEVTGTDAAAFRITTSASSSSARSTSACSSTNREPTATAITLSRTSTERKATGSFYTPQSAHRIPGAADADAARRGQDRQTRFSSCAIVDPAMGSGAFLVAACRFLAECCEQAMVRDGQWLDGDATAGDRAILRRSVAERCLYGVDLNPTAVQLARLSLWLTTLAADRPLTFLDHHLASGNSLIGARLADLARPMRPGRRARRLPPLPLFDDQIAG